MFATGSPARRLAGQDDGAACHGHGEDATVLGGENVAFGCLLHDDGRLASAAA